MSNTVRKIFDEILTSDDVESSLEQHLRSGWLVETLPEIAAIVELGDGDHLHKDVWQHTKAVVAGTPNLLELRWAALLHDIGKAPTRRIAKNGHVTFMNHDVVGARMVDKLAARTKLFQNDDVLLSTIRTLVLQHLRPPSYGPSWTDSAVRRLVSDCGGERIFSGLMMLSRADLTTRIAAKRNRALARAQSLEDHAYRLIAEDLTPRLPKGTMGIIIELTGRAPGSWLKTVQVELESALRSGKIPLDFTADDIAKLYIDGNV